MKNIKIAMPSLKDARKRLKEIPTIRYRVENKYINFVQEAIDTN